MLLALFWLLLDIAFDLFDSFSFFIFLPYSINAPRGICLGRYVGIHMNRYLYMYIFYNRTYYIQPSTYLSRTRESVSVLLKLVDDIDVDKSTFLHDPGSSKTDHRQSVVVVVIKSRSIVHFKSDKYLTFLFYVNGIEKGGDTASAPS